MENACAIRMSSVIPFCNVEMDVKRAWEVRIEPRKISHVGTPPPTDSNHDATVSLHSLQ